MIKVRHVGITVDNLDKMLSFYSTILGFNEQKIKLEQGEYIDNFSSLKNVQVTTAKLSNGHSEVLVELLKYHSHKGTYNKSELINRGITHFALTVGNLSLLYEKCIKAGIKFNSTLQRAPDGKALVTFCRDPEDNLLELVEVIN
jgi:catechol 2,3-dioxygenase-like lactoylglutathione lyase family enzyme